MGAADEVVALFDARGAEHHGEVVDQMSHALQSAAEAQRRGAHDALVAACLLHDIGHLLAAEAEGPRADLTADDDRHEAVGARWLAPRFGPSVARPVALHVVAKRWRCTTDPAYHDALSAASQATLVAQGGLLDPDEVIRFERSPGFADAVVLRECDEAAKEPGRATPDLATFVPLLERLVVDGPARARNLAWAVDVCLTPALEGADVLVAPAYGPAWKSDLVVGGHEGAPASCATTPAAIAGWPVISVPAGVVGGLPVGVALVARPGQEAVLLDAARRVEAAVADVGPLPPVAWRPPSRG